MDITKEKKQENEINLDTLVREIVKKIINPIRWSDALEEKAKDENWFDWMKKVAVGDIIPSTQVQDPEERRARKWLVRKIKLIVAKDRRTSAYILKLLVENEDNNEDVREAAAMNPNVPYEVSKEYGLERYWGRRPG